MERHKLESTWPDGFSREVLVEAGADRDGATVVVAAEGTTVSAYGRISVHAEKCTGCRCCELACSLRNYGECNPAPVSYTHLRAHETRHDLVCRLLLEKKKKK